MKKMILAVILFTLVSSTALSQIPAAIASPVQQQKIKVIHADEGRILALGEDHMNFKNSINPKDARDLSLMVVTHPPQQGGAPLHTNPPEYFYIMSGEFEFFGSQPNDLQRASAGDIVQVESDTPHGYKHLGNGIGEMLVITAPTWLQDYFEELGTPVKDKSETASSPSMEQTIIAGRKHEINYLDQSS